VFWLMRADQADLEGRSAFCFGVEDGGDSVRAIPNVNVAGLSFQAMSPQQKKMNFFLNMNWNKFLLLFLQAGIIIRGDKSYVHDVSRTKAMLVLTVIHDIMKNTILLPKVAGEHSPYCGHNAGVTIVDHDCALAYVLEHYPSILPSYFGMDEESRKVILFSQGSMGFNIGWFVQAEAPPGPLFANFRKLITRGTASDRDVAFYFVHWLTDLAASVPTPFEGMLKFTTQFPDFVIRGFLESMPFLWRLAYQQMSKVYMDYLEWRWGSLVPDVVLKDQGDSAVAKARLCVAAQLPERAKKVLESWDQLSSADQSLLSKELSLTGVPGEKYLWGCPVTVGEGPCFVCYYAPALLTNHIECERPGALKMLAEIYRAGRALYPLEKCQDFEESRFVTLGVANLKEKSSEYVSSVVNNGFVWVLEHCTEKDAVVNMAKITALASHAGNAPTFEGTYVVLPFWSD